MNLKDSVPIDLLHQEKICLAMSKRELCFGFNRTSFSARDERTCVKSSGCWENISFANTPTMFDDEEERTKVTRARENFVRSRPRSQDSAVNKLRHLCRDSRKRHVRYDKYSSLQQSRSRSTHVPDNHYLRDYLRLSTANTASSSVLRAFRSLHGPEVPRRKLHQLANVNGGVRE